MIPSKKTNPKGLHRKYIISKVSGEPIDPGAEYFVLRLDTKGGDPIHINACRVAALAYANEIEHHIPKLAADLYAKYNQAVMPGGTKGKRLRYRSP